MIRRNTIHLLVAALMLLFTACKKNTDAVVDANAALELKNVSYAANAAQIMDVYLPANRTATATNTIIFIHGGSWSAGDKADFDSAILYLKTQLTSYAIFNINYRLANGTSILYTQQMQDIDLAINFIVSKSAEYRINPNKIALVGASAGSHLALSKAYRGNTDGKIKAVVDLFGPNDLTWMYNNHPIPTITQPILVNLLATTPTLGAATYTQASPINGVSSSAPPTIIFHGTADLVVPISESDRLKAKLVASAVLNQYITYAGEGHGFTNPINIADMYAKSIQFIKTNMP
jgi:acetyl esterase/lipase